jgi:hypothetical protein
VLPPEAGRAPRDSHAQTAAGCAIEGQSTGWGRAMGSCCYCCCGSASCGSWCCWGLGISLQEWERAEAKQLRIVQKRQAGLLRACCVTAGMHVRVRPTGNSRQRSKATNQKQCMYGPQRLFRSLTKYLNQAITDTIQACSRQTAWCAAAAKLKPVGTPGHQPWRSAGSV